MLRVRPQFLRWRDDSRLLVGLNCLQPFGYGATSGGAYVASPYVNGGADSVVMPTARMQAQKAAGIDFQRMAIDPGTLLAADSASNSTTTVLDGLIAQIKTGIDRRLAVFDRVMVDLHFVGASPPVSGWSFIDVLDGGTKFTRFKFIAQRLAAMIRAYYKPSQVCLQWMNEPPSPADVSTASYITHSRAMHQALRGALPRHTLIVDGNYYSAIDSTPYGASSGLTAHTPSHYDLNTGFSFHGYESPAFTHQGVTDTIFDDVHGLTFPAADHPGGKQKAKDDLDAAATAAGHAANIDGFNNQPTYSYGFDQYFSNYGSEAALAARLKVATDWIDAASGFGRKNLMNTEFGVNFGGADDASAASATAFIQAIKRISAAAGINCIVLHEMQGSDFAAQDDSAPWAMKDAVRLGLAA